MKLSLEHRRLAATVLCPIAALFIFLFAMFLFLGAYSVLRQPSRSLAPSSSFPRN